MPQPFTPEEILQAVEDKPYFLPLAHLVLFMKEYREFIICFVMMSASYFLFLILKEPFLSFFVKGANEHIFVRPSINTPSKYGVFFVDGNTRNITSAFEITLPPVVPKVTILDPFERFFLRCREGLSLVKVRATELLIYLLRR